MYFVIRDLEDTKAISEINPASSVIDYNKIANKIKYTIIIKRHDFNLLVI